MILMAALCVSFSMPVSAAEVNYVEDETGLLADSDINRLNELAESLSNALDCDLLYAYTCEEDMDAYVRQASLGSRPDQILMVENDEYWDVYVFGEPQEYLEEDEAVLLRDAFDSVGDIIDAQTYSDAVAAYMYEAESIVRSHTEIADSTDGSTGADVNGTILLETPVRMVDMADILTESEEAAFLAQLDELSERQQLDVVIVTVKELDGKSHMEYADDFFDYNGYGIGGERDGLLYLVKVESDGSYSKGNSWISTCGYGITAFTDEGIQYIGGQITPELLDGDYTSAFEEFITLADEFVTQAREGEAYDVGNMPEAPFPLEGAIFLALIVGVIVSFTVTRRMKRKLQSVRSQAAASDYIKRGGLKVTARQEVFLYSHVDRREKPQETSSGGGSSTHTSSSGSTHGGGGF